MDKKEIELLQHAAALLDAEALSLRECHNVDHRNPDWKDEPEAKAAHDDCKDTSTQLYALAEAATAAALSSLQSPEVQEPVIKYVPISTDKEYERHPNDKTEPDADCSNRLNELGDDRGQGLSPYWKWGFRTGWREAKKFYAATLQQPALSCDAKKVRDEALEQAAHICDESSLQPAIAKRIRSLKGQSLPADAERKAQVLAFETAIKDFVSGYEIDTWEGIYQPNEHERFLIDMALRDALHDDDFGPAIAAIAKKGAA